MGQFDKVDVRISKGCITLKTTGNNSVYKPRIVDKLVEKDLRVFGEIRIEEPKWCRKTWTSSHHANNEFQVGDHGGNFSNRMLAEAESYSVLKGDIPRLIDEWQEVPSLWDAARAFVDENSNNGQMKNQMDYPENFTQKTEILHK